MWEVKYIEEALEELLALDKGIRAHVLKGIEKVKEDPRPNTEGGRGKPLGNKHGNNLTGYFKIKYNDIGIRVVYTLDRQKQHMIIVVVSAREEGECYKIAEKRKK